VRELAQSKAPIATINHCSRLAFCQLIAIL
jgi:hypothetical protein